MRSSARGGALQCVRSSLAGSPREWNWVPQDAGEIDEAHLLESLALLWIGYGFRHNHWEHAFALLNRADRL